jgi:hypothetical protein
LLSSQIDHSPSADNLLLNLAISPENAIGCSVAFRTWDNARSVPNDSKLDRKKVSRAIVFRDAEAQRAGVLLAESSAFDGVFGRRAIDLDDLPMRHELELACAHCRASRKG